MKTTICILLISTSIVYCQDVVVTGVPFLLISPSPEANGMAGISTALPLDDPTAIVTNPAQLGLLSLDRRASVSIYPASTQWLPKFNLADLTYDVKTVMVGITSDDVYPLPVKLSLGAAYSRVYLNLGNIQRTGPGGPEVISTFHSYEVSDAFSIALAAESVIKFGIGFTLKRITSNLSPVGVEQGEIGTGKVKASAYDVGFLLNIPVLRLFESSPEQMTFSFIPGTNSALDMSFAYARTNIGDGITYPNQETDPLPRYASIGYGIEYSLVSTSTTFQGSFIRLAFARQVEDLLVKRNPDFTKAYQTGLGDINIYDGLIAGTRSKPVEILTGWRITLYELFSLRFGRYNGTGSRFYRTEGYSIHLRGLWNLFTIFNPEHSSTGVLGFLREHIDGAVNFSVYRVKNDHPLSGTQFFGFIISYR